MYTLRTFNSDGIQRNQYLGNSYEYINRDANGEIFRKCYREAFGNEHVADLDENSTDFSKDCVGFLINEKGTLIYLSKKETYYVMSSDGKTFANLTYRGK